MKYRIRPMRGEDLPQAVMLERVCFTSEAWSEKVYREEFSRAGTYLWLWAAVAQEPVSGESGDDPDCGKPPWAAVTQETLSGVSEGGPDKGKTPPQPPGEMLLGTISLTRAGDEGEIGNVAVLPAYRRRGIAGALLKEALEFGRRSQGMQDFTLEVRAGNHAAIRLYEAAGFRFEGRRPGFYTDPAEDALILWRRNKS